MPKVVFKLARKPQPMFSSCVRTPHHILQNFKGRFAELRKGPGVHPCQTYRSCLPSMNS